ncbi:MAG: aldehyde dehydrogenase family protein [Planctomycetota bacterium]
MPTPQQPIKAPWAPLKERLRVIRAFRKRLASESESVARQIEGEVGKPFFEALTADVMPVLAACKWLERRAPRLLKPRRRGVNGMIAMGQRHTVARVPLGKVGIIATWNYPVGLLGVQSAQALAAGNTLVVKPSEHSPRVQDRLCALWHEAGVPEAVLRVIDASRDAGRAMLAGEPGFGAEDGLDHVVFTGSTGVGRAIAGVLAPSLTSSTLELSGRDSAFVLDDAPVELAARELWWAVTANAGQTCMAPKRILVEPGVYAEFCRCLGALAAGAQPRRLITPEAAQTAYAQAQQALAIGGRSLSGICEPPSEAGELRALAIADCPPRAELVAGRSFGPVVAVVPVSGLDEAVSIHRACDQHLATSVWTKRVGRARRELAPMLGSTNVAINDVIKPTAHPGIPIGGHGASGWGLSQGAEGLLGLTRPLAVSATPRLARIPVDDPGQAGANRIARWVKRAYGAAAGGGPAVASPTPPPASGPPRASEPATQARPASTPAGTEHAR